MIGKIVNLTMPHGSSRRQYVKDLVVRIRHGRMIRSARNRYNNIRQLYYVHAITDYVPDGPLVSVVVPCFNTPAKYFEPLLASLFAQGYQNWEFVLIDASTTEEASNYLAKRAKADLRIHYLRTENEGIALNTNKGLAAANGKYIAFLDHDDTLDQNAFAKSVALLESDSALGLVYSDEDKISDDGSMYFEPHFKPDFSLDMLRNVNYITHFVVARKTIVDKLNGIRKGFDGAQDYDFLLRAVDLGIGVGHIPEILYHWRQADGSTAADFSNKKHVTDAGCQALSDHYKRNNIEGVTVKAIESRPGFYRAHYTVPKQIRQIVLSLDPHNLSKPELDFIVGKYRSNKDVIENGIKVVLSAKTAKHPGQTLHVNEPIVPASDETDIISLFALAAEPGVKSVAPKITRQGKIHDMGLVYYEGGSHPLFKALSPDKPLSFGSLEWVRNVSALTGAVEIQSGSSQGRCIVWSHSEFVALLQKNKVATNSKPNYYNPNIEDQVQIIETNDDYIVDLVKVKQ